MATVRNTGGLFSWLPMYHDMGFIQVLGALIYGGRIGLMTPLGFLRDPLSWMRNMTHHRSTVTAGPTFAYRAATDALARAGARQVVSTCRNYGTPTSARSRSQPPRFAISRKALRRADFGPMRWFLLRHGRVGVGHHHRRTLRRKAPEISVASARCSPTP